MQANPYPLERRVLVPERRVDSIDNRTMIPVRPSSEADGQGGVDFFDYDLEKLKVTVTRWNSKGETKRELPLGDGK